MAIRRRLPAGGTCGRRCTLGGEQEIGFASDTERVTGESKRRLQEHVARAVAFGPDLHAVIGTSLDKAGELVALHIVAEDIALLAGSFVQCKG